MHEPHGKRISTFTSPVDGMVIEFTEWDENGNHRISSRVVGVMPTYGIPEEDTISRAFYDSQKMIGFSEAVNTKIRKKLQENFLASRGSTI